jgi:hypothetical protein
MALAPVETTGVAQALLSLSLSVARARARSVSLSLSLSLSLYLSEHLLSKTAFKSPSSDVDFSAAGGGGGGSHRSRRVSEDFFPPL